LMSNAILNHLKSVKCSELASTDILRIKPTDSLASVVSSLLSRKLVSAPIEDENGDTVGIFDVNELISFLVLTSGVFKRAEAEFTTFYVGSAQDTTSAKAVANSRSSTVVAVMNAAYYSSYLVRIDPNDLVSSKLEHFSEGVHRAPLTDANRKLVGWLAQLDIVGEILKAVRSNDACRQMAQKSLEFYRLGHQPKIFTVTTKHSLGDVVEMFNDYQFAAFPLVDENGRLIGNFSMTNVLVLWTEYYDIGNALANNAHEFLHKTSPLSMNPVTAAYSDTLEDILIRMIDRHVHRLWIVDDKGQPVGIVSMSDVLKLVRKFVESGDATNGNSDVNVTSVASIYAIDGRAVGVQNDKVVMLRDAMNDNRAQITIERVKSNVVLKTYDNKFISVDEHHRVHLTDKMSPHALFTLVQSETGAVAFQDHTGAFLEPRGNDVVSQAHGAQRAFQSQWWRLRKL